MRMKDKLDKMQDPNTELIDIDMMLSADKIVIRTVDGSTHTFDSEQIDIINSKIIGYSTGRTNGGGRYIGKYVVYISIDAIILVQYIYNMDE